MTSSTLSRLSTQSGKCNEKARDIAAALHVRALNDTADLEKPLQVSLFGKSLFEPSVVSAFQNVQLEAQLTSRVNLQMGRSWHFVTTLCPQDLREFSNIENNSFFQFPRNDGVWTFASGLRGVGLTRPGSNCLFRFPARLSSHEPLVARSMLYLLQEGDIKPCKIIDLGIHRVNVLDLASPVRFDHSSLDDLSSLFLPGHRLQLACTSRGLRVNPVTSSSVLRLRFYSEQQMSRFFEDTPCLSSLREAHQVALQTSLKSIVILERNGAELLIRGPPAVVPFIRAAILNRLVPRLVI